MKLRWAYRRSAQAVRRSWFGYGHGTDNPWDEAVSLVLHVTGCPDDTAVLAQMVSGAVVQRVRDVAAQRIQTRQPLPYLLGVCHYMGLEFEIEPGVIVPRSPIGYLLQEGLAPWLPDRIERIADLCCGSVAWESFPHIVFRKLKSPWWSWMSRRVRLLSAT